MAKKAKKSRREKKREQENMWMNKRSEQRFKADIQKGENVELEKEHTIALFKKSKKGSCREKRGFFQMTGKYVKGENKEGTEKG